MMRLSVKSQHKVLLILLLLTLPALADESGESRIRPPNSDAVIPALNFKDADIRDVFRAIAYEFQTNIIVDPAVSKRVTIALFNISVFDAVHLVTEDNRLECIWDNRRFYIKTPDKEPEPQPLVNTPDIRYSDGRLYIDSRDVDIGIFVDSLGRISGKNILLTGGTSGVVTGRLQGIDFETGFQNIMRNNGFQVNTNDGIHYVSRHSHYSHLSQQAGEGSKPYWVSVAGDRITLDVRDVRISTLLNELSDRMGLSLVMFEQPDFPVNIRGLDMSLSRVFSLLFRGTDYTFKEEHGIYYVGRKDQRTLHNARLLKFKYLRASNVKELIPANLLQFVQINTVVEHNGIVMNGPEEYVSSLVHYLEELDQPVAQVLIEALVVDYNIDKTLEYGITAGKGEHPFVSTNAKYSPSVDLTGTGTWLNEVLGDLGNVELFGTGVSIDFAKLGKLPGSFYVNLKALEQRGLVSIKSRPVLSTMNGHTASLEIGTIQNYVFTEIMPITNVTGTTFIEKEVIESIEATISFEITPWVGPGGGLTLEIKPSFQTPVGQFTPDKRFIPAINTRTFHSTVSIKDGETIILGGLIHESEIDVESRVPILGSIPLIGKLFRSVRKESRKSELVIYITPRIDYGSAYMPSF
jgi:type IV pilus assembly protein PilQ